ncbi:MAG: hypothetical protein ACLQL2_10635 [Methylovirgula sp.]
MARLSVGLTAIVLFGFAAAAFAQDGQPPAHAPHKTHVKKVETHAAKKAVNPNDFSEDWDIAAPKSGSSHPVVGEDPAVSAGRKKFFDQSTTMENGGPAGAGSSRSSGFTPSMGMSF